MHRAKLTLVSVLTVVAIIVILQNTEPVETRLLFATVSMPRAVLLLLVLALGFLLGLAFSFASQRKQQDP